MASAPPALSLLEARLDLENQGGLSFYLRNGYYLSLFTIPIYRESVCIRICKIHLTLNAGIQAILQDAEWVFRQYFLKRTPRVSMTGIGLLP